MDLRLPLIPRLPIACNAIWCNVDGDIPMNLLYYLCRVSGDSFVFKCAHKKPRSWEWPKRGGPKWNTARWNGLYGHNCPTCCPRRAPAKVAWLSVLRLPLSLRRFSRDIHIPRKLCSSTWCITLDTDLCRRRMELMVAHLRLAAVPFAAYGRLGAQEVRWTFL